MVEAPFPEDELLARLDRRVERHEQRELRVDALQPVHPVRHADRRVVAIRGGTQVVPGRPRLFPFRHQPSVAMQHDAVRPVGNCRQDGGLGIRRVAEHRQRLVAVAGDDQRIIAFRRAMLRPHRHAERIADHRNDLCRGAEGEAGRRKQPVEVTARAARHGAPHGALVMDEPVVFEEGDERARRIVEHLRPWRRPDRGGHRYQVVVAESVRETFAVEIVADCHSRRAAAVAVGDAFAVEPQDLAQHPQKAR